MLSTLPLMTFLRQKRVTRYQVNSTTRMRVLLSPPQNYTYVIPLGDWEPGTNLSIAAHAEVLLLNETGYVVQEETAWDEGDGFPGKNWAMYFNYTVQ